MKVLVLVVIMAFVVAITALDFAWNSYKCRAKWEGSGLEVKWRPIAGCRVKRENGNWVPAANFRDTE